MAEVYCDLPIYSDDEHGDVSLAGEVYSWDATRVMRGGDYGWRIEQRADIAHTMPRGWHHDSKRDEWYSVAGERSGETIHGTVWRDDEARDEYCWQYRVTCPAGDGLGEHIDEGSAITSREAAEMAVSAIATLVMEAAPPAVCDLLVGTQPSRASRLGVSEGTVSEWISGNHEMPRSTRHLVLALLGYQMSEGGQWERVR